MRKSTAVKKRPPFEFVLDELEALQPLVQPMFGCHAVYAGEKLVLFLCDAERWAGRQGIWVPTTPEHYASLAAEFTGARKLMQDGVNKSPWLLLSVSAADFERMALRACELILQNDPRIGRMPSRQMLKPPIKATRKKN